MASEYRNGKRQRMIANAFLVKLQEILLFGLLALISAV